MKWTVVILIGLGLVAAVCAGGLVMIMQSSAKADKLPDVVDVVMAAKDMPAMSVVGSEDTYTVQLTRKDLPKGYLTDGVKVVGRILATGLTKDQIVTSNCFISDAGC